MNTLGTNARNIQEYVVSKVIKHLNHPTFLEFKKYNWIDVNTIASISVSQKDPNHTIIMDINMDNYISENNIHSFEKITQNYIFISPNYLYPGHKGIWLNPLMISNISPYYHTHPESGFTVIQIKRSKVRTYHKTHKDTNQFVQEFMQKLNKKLI